MSLATIDNKRPALVATNKKHVHARNKDTAGEDRPVRLYPALESMLAHFLCAVAVAGCGVLFYLHHWTLPAWGVFAGAALVALWGVVCRLRPLVVLHRNHFEVTRGLHERSAPAPLSQPTVCDKPTAWFKTAPGQGLTLYEFEHVGPGE